MRLVYREMKNIDSIEGTASSGTGKFDSIDFAQGSKSARSLGLAEFLQIWCSVHTHVLFVELVIPSSSLHARF